MNTVWVICIPSNIIVISSHTTCMIWSLRGTFPYVKVIALSFLKYKLLAFQCVISNIWTLCLNPTFSYTTVPNSLWSKGSINVLSEYRSNFLKIVLWNLPNIHKNRVNLRQTDINRQRIIECCNLTFANFMIRCFLADFTLIWFKLYFFNFQYDLKISCFILGAKYK